jgi:transposase
MEVLMARFDLTKLNGRSSHRYRMIAKSQRHLLRFARRHRHLPERYGPYTTVYNRFNRWAKAGIWLRIFEALAARSPQSLQLIDSSIIRAHQHAAGGKKGAWINAIGRSRGALSTKINAVVDQQGMPVRIVLSQGQSSDKTIAPALLEGSSRTATSINTWSSDCRARTAAASARATINAAFSIRCSDSTSSPLA